MIADKFIDALRGKRYRMSSVAAERAREETAQLIRLSEKFDFGELLLEKRPDLGPGRWSFPGLTPEEIGFWSEGYIPLPAPVVWYEFVLGGTRSGLLVIEQADLWSVQRLDFVTAGTVLDDGRQVPGGVNYDGIWCEVSKQSSTGDSFDITVKGDPVFLKLASRSEAYLQSNIAMHVPLAVYLTLMISSKTTEMKTVVPSSRENRDRRTKGLQELPRHRIVKIVPDGYRYEQHEASGEQRRSPRLHWRRSHLRTYADGKKVVIARMLVGKADLGEVSHEYQIG